MRKKEYMCKYKKCLSNDNILMRYMAEAKEKYIFPKQNMKHDDTVMIS